MKQNRWKNKKNYLQYLSKDYHINKNRTFYIDEKKDSISTIRGKLSIAKSASSYHHNKIQKLFTDELYIYMQSYRLDFPILDIFMIEITSLLINNSQNRKLSLDGHEYSREITTIIKNAESTALYSHDDILIELPIMISTIKNLLMLYLQISKVEEEKINHIFTYLNVRKPRPTKQTKFIITLIDECSEIIFKKFDTIDIDKFKNVIYSKTHGVLYYCTKSKKK